MCRYICCVLFNGFPNEAIQLKLPAAMTRESECVVVSIWANMPAPWFTICRKKKKHPTGSTFTCSKRSPPLSLFTRWNWIGFIYSLLPAYFLFRYTEWGVSMRKAARQQGRKTIHHGDSKDKHIYTCINLGFFSPGPTRASPFFSLPSTFFTPLSAFYQRYLLHLHQMSSVLQ